LSADFKKYKAKKNFDFSHQTHKIENYKFTITHIRCEVENMMSIILKSFFLIAYSKPL